MTQKNSASKTTLVAPCSGVVDSILVRPGDQVMPEKPLLIIESMKMQYPIFAEQAVTIESIELAVGDIVEQGQILLSLKPNKEQKETQAKSNIQTTSESQNSVAIQALLQRRHQLSDQARPDAKAKRAKRGMQTARENIAQLVDENSFQEYGGLLVAAQRSRHSIDELMAKSPADGLITGTGLINQQYFAAKDCRCMVLAYDYSVFAGTQGVMSHKKIDRMLSLADQWKIPLVLFAEGGGGRPNDCDFNGVSGLDCLSFVKMAALSAKVPSIGIVAGRCFAGNAALLGVCDVIIATKNSTIGMAGPAMIEGGGLGRFTAEQIGPSEMQSSNGVIDILVENEAQAIIKAKHYLAYFQGDFKDWSSKKQTDLDLALPENRKMIYNMRGIIEILADSDSVLELRQDFALSVITAFIRIEGKTFGLIANNPAHLGGAINADAADKIARFMQLCDAHNRPMISLCDTPGFMVGPEAEKQASVRHIGRIFVAAASLKIPFFTLVLRKGYGLGAQAMAAGSFHASLFTAAWPTGEFGAMGTEGAIKLAYAKQLAAIDDSNEQQAMLDKLVAEAKQQGEALNVASYMEIDNVILPQQSRQWILSGLLASGYDPSKKNHHRTAIDSW